MTTTTNWLATAAGRRWAHLARMMLVSLLLLAALRHAGSLLARHAASQGLLLLLTDGKPNDVDQYEGRYGIEDTRQAIIELRRLGLHPFCVTIDRKAEAYLPHLFGHDGYALIHRPTDLPSRLLALYAGLTR